MALLHPEMGNISHHERRNKRYVHQLTNNTRSKNNTSTQRITKNVYSKGLSPNTLELFRLFDNQYYRPVDTLSRDPSGQVYDPTLSPPPPRRSKKSKTSSSRVRGERGRREEAPEPEDRGSSSRDVQETSLADANWDQNVTRVLGRSFNGRWVNFSTMIRELREYLRNQRKGKVDLKRAWRPNEFETAARLLAWGLDLEALEALVGMPNKKLKPEEEGMFLGIIQQE